jgi:ABC-type glycerol-3-phosphate transport system substrate-binding protein
MMTKKSLSRLALSAILTSAAFSSGCTQTPAKAPGSNPEDMTVEGHQAAAREEEQKAAQHEREKENVGPSKPNAEMNQKAGHEQQAEQHREYAEQHAAAAEAAGSGAQKAK